MSWVIRAQALFRHTREKVKGVTIRDAHLFICPVSLADVLAVNGQGL